MIIYLNTIYTEEEKEIFIGIYNNYKQLMYYEANSILNDEQLSEDAVHEAFIKILHNLNNIKEINCPKTKAFVVIIVRRISLNYYNKRKKEEIMDINDLENKIYNLPTLIDKLDCVNSISLSLSKLSTKDQDLITLRYGYGFSISEISRMLDISEDALYKRFQRCKVKFRDILHKMEVSNLWIKII